MNVSEQICCALSYKMSFEGFSPIWSHVNEQKIVKITNAKFGKKKWSGDMVDRYLSPKFGINSFSGIRENDVYGRRRTTDARVTTVALPCSSTKQSLKLRGLICASQLGAWHISGLGMRLARSGLWSE